MLILTRSLEEALFIGEARVTILSVTGNRRGRVQVRLGIEAPPDIRILRAELPRMESSHRAYTLASSDQARTPHHDMSTAENRASS